ncbi:MAG: hypothetical protein ACXVBH_13440 [Flavisolibacter sp.]
MKRLIDKVLGAYVHSKYKRMDISLRYFIRDTLYCDLMQWKYPLKDYLFKKRYKRIEFNGEFGPELQFVLPFAYWHYKNGTLKETRSTKNMSEFYFFSPDHKETSLPRSNEGNYNFEVPRILYSHNYNMQKWLPVPLKKMYKNDIYVFEKPILIVANRYNMEWDGPPISFLSIEMLQFIFDSLKDKYTIIYNRPGAQHITMDNSEIYELNEIGWIKENYPEVILMHDLYEENKGKARNFNHLQLMVYANAENFISTHGGTSVLASYFEGTNVILSKQGPEHVFGCYQQLYPKLSGAQIFHAKTDEELKGLIRANFVVSQLEPIK